MKTTYELSIKLLDTLTEQIAVIDKSGCIIYVNKSWNEFGKKNDGVIILSEWDNINYLDICDSSAKLGDSLALEASKGIRSVIAGNNQVFYLEYPCHSPDEERWFMMRVTPFELSDNNYYVLSHHNITERKLAEEKLSKNMIELKNTQNVMIKQSRQAAMGEMISMIAHQWRQPLGQITASFSNIKLSYEFEDYNLAKEEEAIKYQDFINNTINETSDIIQKLSKTINGFTTFYKTDKSTESVTLKDVCEKALNILKPSLIDDKIEIIYDYNSNVKFELIMSEMIQVVYSIIKNAQDNLQCKAVQNPYIKISINTNEIHISDNGGGISDDIIDKIFEPYFSTKSDLNGTGLGLYMSKVIIEDHHNGSLLVNNSDDGVCFSIILNVEVD